jgi:aminoglycoside phosphotransferase (APT) family kinase protein
MLDTATWKRARGWAIWKAMITLVWLRDTNPIEAEKQHRIIRDVLDDHSRASKQAE